MMRQQRKGLSSSMWASEGKSTSLGRPSTTPKAKAPTSSTVNPVVPRQPSPTIPAESCSAVNSIPTPPMSTSGFTSTTPAATTKAKATTAAYKSSDPAADAAQAHRELKRYEQIVRRMQWKKPFLSEGYDKATVKFADEKGRAEAEMMFKLDFYEYYMLLERALVHLMGVFEIGVSPETTSTWGCSSSGKNGRGADFSTKHSFHENVILSLQKEENPLHEVLGTGDVLFQLSRAKTLRNWWKHAEDESKLGARKRRAAAAPLESFDLTLIFNAVFEGLDKGYVIAERWVEVLQSRMSWADEVMDTEEDGEDAFDWMVDAMDWQAV